MRVRRTRVLAAATVSATALTLTLAGCGGGGTSTSEIEEFTVLSIAEGVTTPDILKDLAEGACSAENDALPLKVETIPTANLDQQLQLLAGQGGLPVMFSAGGVPSLTESLHESGDVPDFHEVFDELGVSDMVQPAAISTIEALYGGYYVIPAEYNVEGIWYNTAYFEQYGIDEPASWDELLSAASKLAENGIQPFSASGEQGWPLTRLISNYILRELGDDALRKVKDGEAKLTDPKYVEGAAAVAELGAKGYFGAGLGSVDYGTAINEFLNGNAGMLYMGSWVLSDIAGDANQIGQDNIGFIPFPSVSNGAGSPESLVANVGLPYTFNAKALEDSKVKAWVKCFVENYAPASLSYGTISGFGDADSGETSGLTAEIQNRIAGSDTSILWFEALFGSEATTTSQSNAAPLFNGDISPEEFMALVQADLDRE